MSRGGKRPKRRGASEQRKFSTGERQAAVNGISARVWDL